MSISGASDTNPVDTRRRFFVEKTSYVYKERANYIRILTILALP